MSSTQFFFDSSRTEFARSKTEFEATEQIRKLVPRALSAYNGREMEHGGDSFEEILVNPIVEAYRQFYHSPVLVVNVALRNWRFLDKLGISAGRWFEGFGRFFAIRRPMITGKSTQPFDPDKPAVMTFYVPFNNPGYSIQQQGELGRAELLAKSYGEYEKEIVGQMSKMFAAYGFDAEQDIAGIVLNRWGHAYISPQPGFHFGKDGKDAPKDVVKKGFGRIQFGHSELSGYMSHTRALNEGARAASLAMKRI